MDVQIMVDDNFNYVVRISPTKEEYARYGTKIIDYAKSLLKDILSEFEVGGKPVEFREDDFEYHVNSSDIQRIQQKETNFTKNKFNLKF